MHSIDQIKQVAGSMLGCAITTSTVDSQLFRVMTTIHTVDGVKPLLIVGTANGKFEDGGCIAVLNPDQGLIEKIRSGVGYSWYNLKMIASRRCDAMIRIRNETFREDGVTISGKYVARRAQPAKFAEA